MLDGYGMRRGGEGVFPSNVVFVDDEIPQGGTLDQYVALQQQALAVQFSGAQIKGATPPQIAGAEEVQALSIRYVSAEGSNVVQRQAYARCGGRVGIATFTTVEEERAAVDPIFKEIVSQLRIAGGSG